MKEKTELKSGTTDNQKIVSESQNKKRILYIITKSVFGGAGRYVYELAKRSKEEGFETAVALGGDGPLNGKLEGEGIQVFHLSTAQRDISLFKEFKLLLRLIEVVNQFKPNVVHLNSPKIGGLGAVVGRLLGVQKIVYTNHGWPFKEERPMWQIILIKFFSWLTIFCNKKIIVLSETERGFVKNWPFAAKKIEIIPNGLSEFTPLPKKEALSALLKASVSNTAENSVEKIESTIDENTLVLGTISELHKNKGLGYAIEGIHMYIDQYPDKKIAFIIIGEGERKAELTALVKEKSLESKVFFAGHIDNARNYLSAFDIFLLSSIKEGLPYTILEAGACGIPVIATSVGGIPEVIQNFQTGILIPPRRPQEIKSALVYFEEHPEMIEQMSENLKKELKEKFDFDQIYKKVTALY